MIRAVLIILLTLCKQQECLIANDDQDICEEGIDVSSAALDNNTDHPLADPHQHHQVEDSPISPAAELDISCNIHTAHAAAIASSVLPSASSPCVASDIEVSHMMLTVVASDDADKIRRLRSTSADSQLSSRATPLRSIPINTSSPSSSSLGSCSPPSIQCADTSTTPNTVLRGHDDTHILPVSLVSSVELEQAAAVTSSSSPHTTHKACDQDDSTSCNSAAASTGSDPSAVSAFCERTLHALEAVAGWRGVVEPHIDWSEVSSARDVTRQMAAIARSLYIVDIEPEWTADDEAAAQAAWARIHNQQQQQECDGDEDEDAAWSSIDSSVAATSSMWTETTHDHPLLVTIVSDEASQPVSHCSSDDDDDDDECVELRSIGDFDIEYQLMERCSAMSVGEHSAAISAHVVVTGHGMEPGVRGDDRAQHDTIHIVNNSDNSDNNNNDDSSSSKKEQSLHNKTHQAPSVSHKQYWHRRPGWRAPEKSADTAAIEMQDMSSDSRLHTTTTTTAATCAASCGSAWADEEELGALWLEHDEDHQQTSTSHAVEYSRRVAAELDILHRTGNSKGTVRTAHIAHGNHAHALDAHDDDDDAGRWHISERDRTLMATVLFARVREWPVWGDDTTDDHNALVEQGLVADVAAEAAKEELGSLWRRYWHEEESGGYEVLERIQTLTAMLQGKKRAAAAARKPKSAGMEAMDDWSKGDDDDDDDDDHHCSGVESE